MLRLDILWLILDGVFMNYGLTSITRFRQSLVVYNAVLYRTSATL